MPCAVTEGNAMDNTDISVLELLVSDARHTDSELAVMLGISQEELRGRHRRDASIKSHAVRRKNT